MQPSQHDQFMAIRRRRFEKGEVFRKLFLDVECFDKFNLSYKFLVSPLFQNVEMNLPHFNAKIQIQLSVFPHVLKHI